MVYLFIEPAAKFPHTFYVSNPLIDSKKRKKKIRTKIKARTTRSMCEQIKTFTFIQIQNWNLCCLRADCRSDIWTSIWEKRRIYLSALCVCVRSMRPKSVNFFLWPINNFHIPFNNYIILQDVCCLGVGCSKRSKQASEAHSHHRTSSCVEQIIKETFAQIIIIVYMLRSGVEGDGRPAHNATQSFSANKIGIFVFLMQHSLN